MISTIKKPCDGAVTTNEEIRLKLSVSTNAYKTKPDKIVIQAMRFKRQELTIEKFIDDIKQGYCFCHHFTTKEPFGVTDKKIINFERANVVFFDIDKSSISMDDYVSTISIKPTVAYTTPSNNPTDGIYCFRMCFVFSEDITSNDMYKAQYRSLAKIIQHDIPQVKLDNHVGHVAQYVNGNGEVNCDIRRFDNILPVFEFIGSEDEATKKSIESKPNCEKDYAKYITDNEFMIDFNRLSPIGLRDKYADKYPFFDKSPLIAMDGYYVYPDDYTEIKRRKRIDSFAKSDKELILFSRYKLIRDGEGRRNKAYTGCLIRRQINPNVTFEHLLMNLVIERLYYFDNTDKVLTNKVLMDIAYNALSLPIEEINIPRYRPHEFAVNRDYCAANSITVRQQCGAVRRNRTDELIGQYYDFNLSLRANVKMLSDYGLKVSYSRLRQFVHSYT